MKRSAEITLPKFEDEGYDERNIGKIMIAGGRILCCQLVTGKREMDGERDGGGRELGK